MTQTTDDQQTSLVPVSKINTIEKFTDSEIVDQILEAHEIVLREYVPDTSTKKGRDEIKSFAFMFRKSKTAFDDAGKKLIETAQAQVKLVNSERKRARETFDRQAEEARKPLTDWEEERDRIEEEIKQRIKDIENIVPLATETGSLTSEVMKEYLAELEAIKIDDSFGDHETLAHRTRDAAVVTLRDMIAKKVKAEEDAAELERLRKAEREQKRKDDILEHVAKISAGVAHIISRANGEEDIDRRIFILDEARTQLQNKIFDAEEYEEFTKKADQEQSKGIEVLSDHLNKWHKEKEELARDRADKEREEREAEAAEKRTATIKNMISTINDLAHDPSEQYAGAKNLTSDQILDRIKRVGAIDIDESYGELQAEAFKVKEETASDLEIMLKAAFDREHLEKVAAEEAEEGRLEGARQKERDEIQADNRRKENAAAEREADKAHCEKCHKEALEDIMKFLPPIDDGEGLMLEVILQIRKGAIRHVEIKY